MGQSIMHWAVSPYPVTIRFVPTGREMILRSRDDLGELIAGYNCPEPWIVIHSSYTQNVETLLAGGDKHAL